MSHKMETTKTTLIKSTNMLWGKGIKPAPVQYHTSGWYTYKATDEALKQLASKRIRFELVEAR